MIFADLEAEAEVDIGEMGSPLSWLGRPRRCLDIRVNGATFLLLLVYGKSAPKESGMGLYGSKDDTHTAVCNFSCSISMTMTFPLSGDLCFSVIIGPCTYPVGI